MIAVTIATPDYMPMATTQAHHFQRHSGLKTVIVMIDSKSDGYAEKLNLPDLFPSQKIVFFDADYRLIRDVSFKEFLRSGGVHGVHDGAAYDNGSFPCLDCKTLGIPPNEYINTGLFIADFSSEGVVKAFAIARQLNEDRKNGHLKIEDKTEQSILNAGIQRSAAKITHMHPRWNFYPYGYHHGFIPEMPRNIIGIQAAGISGIEEKTSCLDAYQKVFGGHTKEPIKSAAKEYRKWSKK